LHTREPGRNVLALATPPAASVTVTVSRPWPGVQRRVSTVPMVMPPRVSEREEAVGLDVVQHGEEAYTSGEGAILVVPESEVEEGLAVRQP
jgi:hypothetical protein